MAEDEIKRQSENDLLLYLEHHLSRNNETLQKYDLPEPVAVIDYPRNIEDCQIFKEERPQDIEEIISEKDKWLSLMNKEQKKAYDAIMNSIERNTDNPTPTDHVFFVDGPGGTGKTLLFNAVLNTVRGNGDYALACATSGIVSILLKFGRTIHSRFKVPV